MRSHDIPAFLNRYDQIVEYAEIVRSFVHQQNLSSSISKYVNYSSLENEPLGFKAKVLHVNFIGRFEVSKQDSAGREFLAGQYAFFRKDDDKEVRIAFTIRILQEGVIVLPDGKHIEIYSDTPADDPANVQQLRRVKDSISQGLLSEVIDNLEKWQLT